jgi:hypothetical protein
MAKTEPLQSQEVLPLAGHMKQLSVAILKWIPSAGWHGQLEVKDELEQSLGQNYW